VCVEEYAQGCRRIEGIFPSALSKEGQWVRRFLFIIGAGADEVLG